MPYVLSIGSAVVEATPGDHFDLIARQTSGSAKDATAEELTWPGMGWSSEKACARFFAPRGRRSVCCRTRCVSN